jgi:hypothetical protein
MATRKQGERPAQTWDGEIGTVTLTNTKQYPFNDSERTVALARDRGAPGYFVQTEIVKTDGEVGDILISGKAVNGFKLAFTGSAKNVDIRYLVTGGF